MEIPNEYGKIRKTGKVPRKNIIISFSKSTTNNLSRNMVKAVQIRRFEKNLDEKTTTKTRLESLKSYFVSRVS